MTETFRIGDENPDSSAPARIQPEGTSQDEEPASIPPEPAKTYRLTRAQIKVMAWNFFLAWWIQSPAWWYLKFVGPVFVALLFSLNSIPRDTREHNRVFRIISRVTVYGFLLISALALVAYSFGVYGPFVLMVVVYGAAFAAILKFIEVVAGASLFPYLFKLCIAGFWIYVTAIQATLFRACWTSSPVILILGITVAFLVWKIVAARFRWRLKLMSAYALFILIAPQLFITSLRLEGRIDWDKIRGDSPVKAVMIYSRPSAAKGDAAAVGQESRKIAMDPGENFIVITFSPHFVEDEAELPTFAAVDMNKWRKDPGRPAQPFATLRFGAARDIIYDPDQNVLYSTIYDKEAVAVISFPELRLLRVIDTGQRGPHNLAFDRSRKRLLVGHESGWFQSWSTAPEDNFKRIGETLTPGNPQETAVDPARQRAYLVSMTPYQLMALDVKEVPEITDVRLSPFVLWGIAFDPLDRRLYTAHFVLGQVREWDADGLAVRRVFWTGSGTRVLEVDPKLRLLYVGNYCTGRLSVIDLDTGRSVFAIYLGKKIRGILVTPKSRKAYITSSRGLFELDPLKIKGITTERFQSHRLSSESDTD